MSFFAPALGTLWNQLEAYGQEPAAVFLQVGIDPDAIFDQSARVAHETFDRLLQLAKQSSGDPLFGLKGQEYFRPAHLGALGFAWLASSSIRDAFQRVSRYARVINEALTVTLETTDSDLVVNFYARLPSLDESLREDVQLSIATKCCRAIAGNRFHPARIRYRQSEPADTGFHHGFYRCPIEFEAAATSMLIPLEVADKKLTGANEEMARLNEHIVVKYLAHSAREDVVNRTKAAIIDSLGSGSVTETMIAEALHMTPRNLHRKLTREDTSFSLLLNEVRQELAQLYIKDRSMTLTEISFMLGFSEVSSFSRAYKNWTGQAPSSARQAGTARPAAR
jgi:AraC-like DNA-binding protein